ncbi:MAG: hypothetical protein EA385_12540 [Salinarimonadaceae bacterium]|nr:MAG: hypothetical protein EA385_12540 [Salinarimonadaceae bacterium]
MTGRNGIDPNAAAAPTLPPRAQVDGGARRLFLPPPYTQHRIETGDVHAEAVRCAQEEGAGTFVWSFADGLLAFAVVLEPEEKLREARLAFFAGMAALADALAAHCAPDKPLRIVYPDTISFDLARIGGARLSVAPGAGEEEAPDWMVFSVELIADRDHLPHPGMFPETSSLKEEEFDEPEAIVEAFASYLMLAFDRWRHQGIDAVIAPYLERLDPPMPKGARALADGDLVEREPSGETRRVDFLEALAACRWRGEKGPKL